MSLFARSFTRRLGSLGRQLHEIPPYLAGDLNQKTLVCTSTNTNRGNSSSIPYGWSSQFAVEPGTTVEITADEGNVDVRNGSDLYAVDFHASGGQPETQASARREEKGEGENGGTTIRVRAEHSGLVSAHIPERYCSAFVRAPLGAVSVANITEANLDVHASKSVDLGSIRGIEVAVESEGGDISNSAGGMMSGTSVKLEARRGAVDMKKVVGNAVEVEARKAVTMTSLYSNTKASVSCASGNVRLGNVGCTQLLVIAEEGDVDIDGVSGSLHVDGCKRVKAHVSRDCQTVRLCSVQQDIKLTIEPGTRIRCNIENCAAKVLSEDIVVLEEEKRAEGEMHVLWVKGKENTTGRLEGGPENELFIDAPGARVSIAASSWLTGLFKRNKSQ